MITNLIVAIITVAIVSAVVTNPTAAQTINRLGHFMSASIKGLLGADYE